MTKKKTKMNRVGTTDVCGQNVVRALRAERALMDYQNDTGIDLEDAVCDLLADIMHWCERSGQDFENRLRRARMHHEAEQGP